MSDKKWHQGAITPRNSAKQESVELTDRANNKHEYQRGTL
jgi:hypothetical protein